MATRDYLVVAIEFSLRIVLAFLIRSQLTGYALVRQSAINIGAKAELTRFLSLVEHTYGPKHRSCIEARTGESD